MLRQLRETISLWHARQHLRGLPDHVRRDIGIERSDMLLAAYCGGVPARRSADAAEG